MGKITKTKLLCGIISAITCIMPWGAYEFLDWDTDYFQLGIGTPLGFMAFLMVGLSTVMVFIKEFAKYAHIVSLLPFAICAIAFLTHIAGALEDEMAFGIYLSLIATLVQAVVFWKYKNINDVNQ